MRKLLRKKRRQQKKDQELSKANSLLKDKNTTARFVTEINK